MTRVTLALIEYYLDRAGCRQHLSEDEPDELEGLVRTGWSDGAGRNYALIVDPMIERGVVAFRVQRLATARPSEVPPERLRDLMLAMSYFNCQTSQSKWDFDVRDGEVNYRHYLQIDDGLPFERFEKHFHRVMEEVNEVGPVLADVAEGRRTARDVFEREEVIIG